MLKTQSCFYKNLSDSHENFYQLSKTKKLYEEFFPKQNKYRKQMLYIGALMLPIFALLFNAQGDNLTAVFLLGLALIISFMSEIIGRYLFYVTAVSQGLAGNFFVGNQR